MTEKELKELEKFAKENGYNDELKDIYLREVIDSNKEYEWDQIFDQIDRDKLIKWLKIVKQANPSSICESILKS